MSLSCWEYVTPDGTKGRIMAHTKAHALLTIKELHPTINLLTLTLFREDLWTSNQH